ncbi:MAG: hypothetical protein D6690_17730 [Nitrospirae bacterium]|nr:MAG: hypothetical protein D6690_17730 [Nitrospirota bacterium]
MYRDRQMEPKDEIHQEYEAGRMTLRPDHGMSQCRKNDILLGEYLAHDIWISLFIIIHSLAALQ